MEVICLQDEAFFTMIERVVERLKDKQSLKNDQWLSGEEAMNLLKITSKTTLQKLRDDGKIRFSQTEKNMILYDAASINEYLNKNAKDTFLL